MNKLEFLFNKIKELSFQHKTYFDELESIIEASEEYGYSIRDIPEITETLIDAQGNLEFEEFLEELNKGKFFN